MGYSQIRDRTCGSCIGRRILYHWTTWKVSIQGKPLSLSLAYTFLACLSYTWLPTCSSLSAAAAAAKLLQSCPTLCDPTDGSPPGSPVLGILQVRTLEWVAISFSKVWKWKVKVKWLSHVWFVATPWTAAHQAPLSMGFSRQEYWSGLPLPSPSALPTPSQYPTPASPPPGSPASFLF